MHVILSIKSFLRQIELIGTLDLAKNKHSVLYQVEDLT